MYQSLESSERQIYFTRKFQRNKTKLVGIGRTGSFLRSSCKFKLLFGQLKDTCDFTVAPRFIASHMAWEQAKRLNIRKWNLNKHVIAAQRSVWRNCAPKSARERPQSRSWSNAATNVKQQSNVTKQHPRDDPDLCTGPSHLHWLQVAWPDKLPSDFTRHFVFNWKITNIHRNYQSATKHEDLKDWGLSRIKYIALPWMFWLAFHGFQIPRSVSAWFNINENCSLAKSNGLCPRSNKIWSLSLLGFHPIPRWNLSQNWRNTKITCTSYNPNRSPDFYCKCKYVLTRQEGQEKNSELRLFTTQWKHATCMSFVSPVAAFKDFLWGCSLQISADLFPRSLSRGSSVLKRWFKHTIFDRVAAAAKKRSWASLPSTEVFGAFKGKTKRSKKSAKSAKKKCLFFAKKLFGLFFFWKKKNQHQVTTWVGQFGSSTEKLSCPPSSFCSSDKHKLVQTVWRDMRWHESVRTWVSWVRPNNATTPKTKWFDQIVSSAPRISTLTLPPVSSVSNCSNVSPGFKNVFG